MIFSLNPCFYIYLQIGQEITKWKSYYSHTKVQIKDNFQVQEHYLHQTLDITGYIKYSTKTVQ